MKKVVLIIGIIIVVLLGVFIAYNILSNSNNSSNGGQNNGTIEYTASKPEDANVDKYPDSVEIIDNVYSKATGKNTINFTNKNGEFMQEFITEYGFTENKFEISVKVFFVKENIENNVTYYQLYSDKDFKNKLVEVSKKDYNEAVKDNSTDGINNYSLDGLIDTAKLESYKYVFDYDSQNRKVTFKEFIKQ